jgi:hypothetical protein
MLSVFYGSAFRNLQEYLFNLLDDVYNIQDLAKYVHHKQIKLHNAFLKCGGGRLPRDSCEHISHLLEEAEKRIAFGERSRISTRTALERSVVQDGLVPISSGSFLSGSGVYVDDFTPRSTDQEGRNKLGSRLKMYDMTSQLENNLVKQNAELRVRNDLLQADYQDLKFRLGSQVGQLTIKFEGAEESLRSAIFENHRLRGQLSESQTTVGSRPSMHMLCDSVGALSDALYQKESDLDNLRGSIVPHADLPTSVVDFAPSRQFSISELKFSEDSSPHRPRLVGSDEEIRPINLVAGAFSRSSSCHPAASPTLSILNNSVNVGSPDHPGTAEVVCRDQSLFSDPNALFVTKPTRQEQSVLQSRDAHKARPNDRDPDLFSGDAPASILELIAYSSSQDKDSGLSEPGIDASEQRTTLTRTPTLIHLPADMTPRDGLDVSGTSDIHIHAHTVVLPPRPTFMNHSSTQSGHSAPVIPRRTASMPSINALTVMQASDEFVEGLQRRNEEAKQTLSRLVVVAAEPVAQSIQEQSAADYYEDVLPFNECYEFAEEIGKGTFGTVYKAYRRRKVDMSLSPLVAIKVVYRDRLSPGDEELIRRENHVMCLLNKHVCHKNVIKFFDFYEDTSAFFMVLELIQGGELFDRLVKKVYYSEKEARDLVQVLLSAMKHCHDHDVVHR